MGNFQGLDFLFPFLLLWLLVSLFLYLLACLSLAMLSSAQGSLLVRLMEWLMVLEIEPKLTVYKARVFLLVLFQPQVYVCVFTTHRNSHFWPPRWAVGLMDSKVLILTFLWVWNLKSFTVPKIWAWNTVETQAEFWTKQSLYFVWTQFLKAHGQKEKMKLVITPGMKSVVTLSRCSCNSE